MTKSYKEIKKEKEGTDVQVEACWSGYKQVGMKKKGNRRVPNCVPESVVNALFGKDYIYEVQSESVADMYKGTLTKAQLAKMKQTWATKKASDLTPSIKNFVKGLDQFTQMDIKHANIKYVSDLIEEFEEGEVELVNNFKDIVEENEMRVSVRRNEDLKEFSTAQIERLAKAYSVMKDRTISLSNAQKLGKMMDGVPDSSLNAIRKKKIPFLSGLALSKMIQKKIPVTESVYLDEARWEIEGTMGYKGISGQDGFHMVIDAPTEKAAEDKAYDELDKARSKRQIGPGGGGNIEDAEVVSVERTSARLQKPSQTHMYSHNPKGDKELKEADLSKSQIKKVHKQADDLPKKDFMKRYGKDGDAVRYATATNMVKKKLGLGEDNKFIKKGELKMNESYKQRLTSAMEHFNISSLGELKDEDQKTFFNYVDGLDEGLSAGQKKLPPALQKAILAKQGKKDDKKEMHDMKKKEMKEEDAYDGTPAEVAKMKAKEKADAEKAKSKNEMMSGNVMAMKAQAMKMPIRSMKKMEDLVGGQKKLDKDKDGDLDAKDFAMLRKTKSEAVKTGEADAEPKVKELNAMVKDPMNAMKDPMNAMKDMNAGYMKSNVKASVMNNGGSDMAKVKDAPKMMTAMMKISNDKKMKNMKAMYGESRENAKRYLDTKPGSLEEAVLVSRGLVKKNLTEARYEIEGRVSYKGVGPEDAFHMVINANSEKDAEDKADDELRKARNKRKIGPGGGGNIDEVEIESVERTNDKLSAPETFRPGN